MNFTKMKEKYKTKKSYRSWLISYFTFIVLFLFVFGIITFLSKNVLEGEIFKANEATFNTINANLNSIKTDINKFAITIATDKYTNAFVQEKDIKDTDYYNVYTLKSTVDNYIKTYDYIEELCILNQNTEQVFVNGNLVPMKSIYKNYKLIKEDGTSQNHDEWKVFLQQRHSQEMYQTSVGDLVYIQSIPFNQNGVLNGTIMLRISKWKINQIINDAGTSDNTFMILNHKNQVVFQSKDNEIANKISTENVDLSPGFKEMEAGGDKMEVFISKPNLNISGVFAVSGKAFWQLLNMFYISALILAFVLLVIGMVLARVFAKKHYTPLESLLKLISKNKTDANPKNNEYDYIESYITEMLTKVNESEHQKKPLQDAFLVRLLKGNIQSISSLEDAMGNVGLSFKFQTFAVIAFYSDDYHVLFTDDETIEDDQREELAQFILKNIMEELFNEKYFSILVSVEYMPVLVVNLSEDAQNNWKQAFGEKLEYAKTAIRDNFGITFQSGVSKVCFSPEELSDAYSEAVETLEHKLLFANESIMFFEDIPEIEENTTHYGYYTEYEKNLVECIKTGN
ncbi:MAG: hypothetical protein RR957_05480, partial [Oscillospiraceae bacterium]